jgi:hypothetical protein
MSRVMRGRAAVAVAVLVAVLVVPAAPDVLGAPAEAGELAEVEGGNVGTWA